MYLLFRVQSILAMLFCTLCFRKKFHRKNKKLKAEYVSICRHSRMIDSDLVQL